MEAKTRCEQSLTLRIVAWPKGQLPQGLSCLHACIFPSPPLAACCTLPVCRLILCHGIGCGIYWAHYRPAIWVLYGAGITPLCGLYYSIIALNLSPSNSHMFCLKASADLYLALILMMTCAKWQTQLCRICAFLMNWTVYIFDKLQIGV